MSTSNENDNKVYLHGVKEISDVTTICICDKRPKVIIVVTMKHVRTCTILKKIPSQRVGKSVRLTISFVIITIPFDFNNLF